MINKYNLNRDVAGHSGLPYVGQGVESHIEAHSPHSTRNNTTNLQQCNWPLNYLKHIVEDSKLLEVVFKDSIEKILNTWNDASVILKDLKKNKTVPSWGHLRTVFR